MRVWQFKLVDSETGEVYMANIEGGNRTKAGVRATKAMNAPKDRLYFHFGRRLIKTDKVLKVVNR